MFVVGRPTVRNLLRLVVHRNDAGPVRSEELVECLQRGWWIGGGRRSTGRREKAGNAERRMKEC